MRYDEKIKILKDGNIMATLKKITEASTATSMNSSDTVLAVSGGSLKRIPVEKLGSKIADQLFYPQYTLEQSSNPAFDIQDSVVVKQYIAAMGGYMLKTVNGKTYAAKLHPTDWNYFADGTAVDDASKYETMVRVPQCHFKASGKTMQFGGLNPISGGHSFDSPQWVGAYEMYVDSSGVGHSRPDVSPSHSMTMSTFWAKAQNRGTQWGLANYGFHCLINALYQAQYGNLNSQSVIGAGGQTSSWEAWRNVNMGLTRTLGDGSGSVLYNDSTVGSQYPTKLFGFEDLWGKLWEFRPGIRFYMDGTTRYAVVYSGNTVSNTADGRTFTCLSSSSGAAITSMQLGEYWDMIPQAAGGSTSTYYCDGCWASTGGELLFVGGHANLGASCGVSYAHSDRGFLNSWTSIGSRLAFYGDTELVSGSELTAMA